MSERALVSRPCGSLGRETVVRALELARWAPSGNNHQPWRVRRASDHLDILYDDSFEQGLLDVNLEAERIAVGMFTETLRLALAEQGVEAEATPVGKDEHPVWARLLLRSSRGGSLDPLTAQIRQRVTNRKLYASGSCTSADFGALQVVAAGQRGVALHFVSAPESMRAIAHAVRLCDSVRMMNPRCHVEFHQQTHWSANRAEEIGTGCYARTYELKPHETAILRLTRSYRVMCAVDAVVRMSSIAAAYAGRQIHASGAIGMLEVANHESATLHAAGVALQRAWLEATRRGLALHPIAVTPFLLRAHRVGLTTLTAAESCKVVEAEASINSIAGAPASQNVVMLLRVGRAPPPSARAARLPAAALLLDE